MKKKVIVIMLAILIIGCSGAVGAHLAGFLDLSGIFVKVPFLQGLAKKPPELTAESFVSPIEEENKKLRGENSELQSKITALEEEKRLSWNRPPNYKPKSTN